MKAAEQGLPESQNNLGHCYEKGQGVVQDYCEAYKFYKMASEKKDQLALRNLNKLKSHMTSKEVAEGERRWRECNKLSKERPL
jgi:TPR repeat protein